MSFPSLCRWAEKAVQAHGVSLISSKAVILLTPNSMKQSMDMGPLLQKNRPAYNLSSPPVQIALSISVSYWLAPICYIAKPFSELHECLSRLVRVTSCSLAASSF